MLPRGRLRITEPLISAKTLFHMLPSAELCAAIKSDRLACVGWQGRQIVDSASHDRFGLPVRVLQNNCKSADALAQRCDIGLPKFLAEHDQITFPVTKLIALPDGFRTVFDGKFLKKLTAMMSAPPAWPAGAQVAWQMLVELLCSTGF